MARRIFSIGLPVGFTTLAEVGMFALAVIFVGWLGETALAAHGIALQILSTAIMIHMRLANATSSRAGFDLGRGDARGIRLGALAAMSVSAITALGVGLVLFLAPTPLVAFFLNTDDPNRWAILKVAVPLVLLGAAFHLFHTAQIIQIGLLRGIQDTKTPMLVAFASYWGVGLTLSYVLGIAAGFGLIGIWAGLTTGLLATFVTLAWRFWTSAAVQDAARQPQPQH